VGETIAIRLGGKSGLPGNSPFAADFRVLALSEGRFQASGPMLAAAEMDFGLTALLEIDGVRIAVGSRAIQTMDQSMFRHLGIEPCEQRIIAVKSSVHFRNDFQHIATAVLSVIAPGPVTCDLSKVPFSDSRLRRLAQKGVKVALDS